MGCHTWFSRPLTENEFKLVKEYAPTEIELLVGPNSGIYDKHLYELLMKSYNENIACVYNKYWWQLGYGSSNPNLLRGEHNYIHEIKGHYGLYVDIEKYHDIFRVKNYPTKVIHNRRELRKWMKKKYFELTDYQLEKISEFFREYPDGVITFG